MIKKLPSEVITLEKRFEVIIEEDEDGIYVASVPDLGGCHTQAKTLNELRVRITEAVRLYLDVVPEIKVDMEYKKE
jgi:predicted RNase H-like HicB family nuclease